MEMWGSCKNGGMCCRNVGYVAVAEMGVCVVEMWGSCKNGGMCCRNVGYVSVAEMGVCVVEMGGMYQLQKWGYVLWKCGVVAKSGGMCCRNVGYVSVAETGGYVRIYWNVSSMHSFLT